MIIATLNRIQRTDPISLDDMNFNILMPESEYKAATTVEDRVALALRILAAMEKGMLSYQNVVNNLRDDMKMERADFGYPHKTVACQ